MSDIQERRIGGLTITINRPNCIGSRNCVQVAPEVFQLDAKGIVTFTQDAPDIGRERLIEACRICPVEALHFKD